MIRLINHVTGTDMWVADNRLNEYLERGHKRVPAPLKEPEKPAPAEVTETKKKRKK